ncbi:PepSY-associated TM helix domain-containing protein [Filimonas effusa]|uniref:PepSY domain-containing protein n=1 Tax=Filimonas effusa TaxID=2508721 RepID=A0A4Q1CZC7_9BACT|nr:PepSY-associated TM helix domain-containing protein [Filimonas effusa]RXK80758.1 PepSY domain-containing protein [Filimonas effusa]
MFRRNIYKWHRWVSVIVAVPVLLWAVSGFLHPVMTNVRPQIASQVLPVERIDSGYIKMPLAQVLKQNGIDSLYSVRIIHIDTSWFYQVKTNAAGRLEYFSALNGNRLKRGDWLYAQYLAKYFLEGVKHDSLTIHKQKPANEPVSQDCCDAATDCVMNASGAEVANVALVTEFNEEYKPNNRLLPVYCVSFNRPDGIRIYVETGQSRFSAAIDDKRALFTRFFSLVHTWGWLSFLGPGRLIVEVVLMLLSLATTIMGLYIFFISKAPQANSNGIGKARRRHRFTALLASLFTLMFSISGGWHVLSHFTEEKAAVTKQYGLPASDVKINLEQWQTFAKGKLSNIGLAYIEGKFYWQLYLMPEFTGPTGKDLMTSRSVAAKPVMYIDSYDNTVLPVGDETYARSLAAALSGYKRSEQVAAVPVTKFNSEYSFIDKRLPVWRIDYGNKVFYIETSTATLAKKLTASGRYEERCFAFLHKHHFMDFAGKAWRDGSTMLGAGLQILMVVVGLILYFRWRNRKRRPVV